MFAKCTYRSITRTDWPQTTLINWSDYSDWGATIANSVMPRGAAVDVKGRGSWMRQSRTTMGWLCQDECSTDSEFNNKLLVHEISNFELPVPETEHAHHLPWLKSLWNKKPPKNNSSVQETPPPPLSQAKQWPIQNVDESHAFWTYQESRPKKGHPKFVCAKSEYRVCKNRSGNNWKAWCH